MLNKSTSYKYKLSINHFDKKYLDLLSVSSYEFYLKDGIYYMASYQGGDLQEIGTLEVVEDMLDNESKELLESMVDDWKADNWDILADLEIDKNSIEFNEDTQKWQVWAKDEKWLYVLFDDGTGNIRIDNAGQR